LIKLEKTDVFGWDAAIRGMRNPMNSWDKSDSKWYHNDDDDWEDKFVIGENDLKLMKSLSKAGNDHSKFLRMINVTVDITAPLYWWKEADTYAVGVVKNSCSTMHKIHAKEFTLDDFSHEHLEPRAIGLLEDIMDALNLHRENYVYCDGGKDQWWQMIQLLPTSYNQKRTVQLNYQVLKSMYFARKNHKLDEWREFCAWVETLPYFKEICMQD
jgi:hypothetical protein